MMRLLNVGVLLRIHSLILFHSLASLIREVIIADSVMLPAYPTKFEESHGRHSFEEALNSVDNSSVSPQTL